MQVPEIVYLFISFSKFHKPCADLLTDVIMTSSSQILNLQGIV